MNQLSQNIGQKLLGRKFKNLKRRKAVQTFQTASEAVIVFDTTIPDCFTPIKSFTKFLKKNEIKSSVYGYVPQKEVPQEMLLWQNFDYITKKDINWFGKPGGIAVDAFFAKEPDMLFVFSFEKNLSIEYLSQLSKARFKIGCFTEETNDYDLMINPGDKKCEISFFIEQVIHYIQLFNPSK